MRRRVKESGRNAPPPPLTQYRGSTNREVLAWLEARQEWWDATPDDPGQQSGDLQWLFDGWEQVGDLHWCGSIAAPCGDPDCLCALDGRP